MVINPIVGVYRAPLKGFPIKGWMTIPNTRSLDPGCVNVCDVFPPRYFETRFPVSLKRCPILIGSMGLHGIFTNLHNLPAPEALQWWDEVLGLVMATYGEWLAAGPLERLQIQAPPEEQCNNTPMRRRMELRASTLLMNAMPAGLKEELVAGRTLSTSSILFKVLRNYQPGGVAEKAETLQALTSVRSVRSPKEAVEKLRKWRGHQLRAAELQVVFFYWPSTTPLKFNIALEKLPSQ